MCVLRKKIDNERKIKKEREREEEERQRKKREREEDGEKRKREKGSAYLGGCKRHNREGPSECRDLLYTGQIL